MITKGGKILMERYIMDERIGCIAIRDRLNTNPDDRGLHEDTQGVVWFRMGGIEGGFFTLPKDTRRLAELECKELNEHEHRLIAEVYRKKVFQMEEERNSY
jgi:hypothetical protein